MNHKKVKDLYYWFRNSENLCLVEGHHLKHTPGRARVKDRLVATQGHHIHHKINLILQKYEVSAHCSALMSERACSYDISFNNLSSFVAQNTVLLCSKCHNHHWSLVQNLSRQNLSQHNK